MLTYAYAELAGDAEAMRRVRAAEDRSGIKTGMRFSARGAHKIEVTFYPNIRWWITDTDASGTPVGERRELTEGEYQATWPLAV